MTTRAWLSALLLPLVVSLGGCSTLESVGSWFSPRKPALQPAPLVDFKPSVQVQRVWEANAGTAGIHVFSPASDGRAVYAAGQEGRIIKLDAASGTVLWRVESGHTLSAGVGVGEGLVLVGTPNGEVLAFHAKDGTPAWRTRLSGELLVPPVAAHGLVAARSNDGSVYALEAGTGKVRWQSSRRLPALTLRQQGHLLFGTDVLYAGHAGGRLTALTLNNGAPHWEANVALPRGVTDLERIADVLGPLGLDARRVCAAAYQGRVACFDHARGSLLWARELSALGGVGMGERALYVVDARGAVHAFDLQRGANPWKQDKLRDRRVSSPVVVTERLVAVGDYQGQVHLIDTAEGAFAARVATDGSAIAGVMLALPDVLVVQTAQGGVYGFRVQGTGDRVQ